ncbi:LysR substrate-binding domain-containing protein [Roseibium sp.]|uniref:LysR substrate-binding domain-containing protein n=1 Tax=Roseibium sp. TaxID=1936156 RepID=UPI003BAF7CC1
MDLNSARSFVQVVEKGGFSAASRALGISKSKLSRHVQQLERSLGVKLLLRSTRRLVLTDIGRDYFQDAKQALQHLDAAEASVRHKSSQVAGTVSFSCSVGMAQFGLRPLLSRFLTDHPQVTLKQQVSNELVDVLGGGLDFAIRGHMETLPDSSLVQRRLATVAWHLFCSPGFLEKNGHPDRPEDLEDLAGLTMGWQASGGKWTLRDGQGAAATVRYSERLRSEDMVSLKQAASDGLGIVALPAYVCREEVRTSHLVRVLPDWTAGTPQISFLMPSRTGVLPPVQRLIAFLSRELPPHLEV